MPHQPPQVQSSRSSRWTARLRVVDRVELLKVKEWSPVQSSRSQLEYWIFISPNLVNPSKIEESHAVWEVALFWDNAIQWILIHLRSKNIYLLSIYDTCCSSKHRMNVGQATKTSSPWPASNTRQRSQHNVREKVWAWSWWAWSLISWDWRS